MAATVAALVALGAAGWLPTSTAQPAEPASATAPAAVQTSSSCAPALSIVNGDVESPVLRDGTWQAVPEASMPGWRTTATAHTLEIWRGLNGITAASGRQLMELNATSSSPVYQDIATVPGQTLRWELSHRGRHGVDTMDVLIGPPTGPLIEQGADLSDGQTWRRHAGAYTVPAGQTRTRLVLRPLTTVKNDPTIGNFVDGIRFGTPACLETSIHATTPSGTTQVDVGDVITYRVTMTNAGATPARQLTTADTLPPGLRLLPGSLTLVDSAGEQVLSDADDQDLGQYDVASRTVRVGGSVLPAGGTRWVTYQARVEEAAADTTLPTDATTTYGDEPTGPTRVADAVAADLTVQPAADLVATLVALAAPVAGRSVSFRAEVFNRGPSRSGPVVLAGRIPAGVRVEAVDASSGACTLEDADLTCEFDDLAVGEHHEVVVTAAVAADRVQGAPFEVSATASGRAFDPLPHDNLAQATGTVQTSADLRVALRAPEELVAGADAAYRATVTNAGPSLARDVVVTSPIAGAASVVSATVPGGRCVVPPSGTIECALPDLSPDASETVTVVLHLAEDGDGDIDAAVATSASTPDPDRSNNVDASTARSAALADVGVDLTLEHPTTRPGEEVGFTLRVINHGPSAAQAISFTTDVPPGTSGSPADSPLCTPVACTIPRLAAGESVTVRGTAVADDDAPSGPGHATVTVVTGSPDPERANDTASVAFGIVLDADLDVHSTVTAADGSGGLVAGMPYRQQVTVDDLGPTRSEWLALRVSLPPGLPVPHAAAGVGSCEFHGVVAADGTAPAGGAFLCRLPRLASTAGWTVTFEGQIPAGFAAATFDSVALVSAAAPDPVVANDTAATATPIADVADVAVTTTGDRATASIADRSRVRVAVRNNGPSTTAVIVQAPPGARDGRPGRRPDDGQLCHRDRDLAHSHARPRGGRRPGPRPHRD